MHKKNHSDQDFMAKDRTVLANERTLLSYIRTALTSCVTGLALIKFFPSTVALVLGIMLLIFAGFIFGYGYIRYGHFKDRIKKFK